jgi:hypothetical protein
VTGADTFTLELIQSQNRQGARTAPPSILARADEVVE